MRLTAADYEGLKTNKASDIMKAYKTIDDYMSMFMTADDETMRDFESLGENTHHKPFKGVYADHITITSSGNEESIYAHVYDNEGDWLFFARLLDTSPEAYSKVAKIAGRFMETFNKYMTINEIY